MTSTTRMITRIVTATGLVVAIVAVTALSATASDRPAASYYTPAALKAMGDRYRAAARFYATKSQTGDRPAASFYTPAALKALGDRYQAQTAFYTRLAASKAKTAPSRSASSYYTPAALQAMGERYQAAASFYEQLQLRKAQQRASAFHWRDAIIGSGIAVALMALVFVAAIGMRRHRRPGAASLS